MAARALAPVPSPDTGFEQDFVRALAGDKQQMHIRDALRRLAEKEPEAFVRGIRTLMAED
jgi:phosphoketolase